MISGTLVLADVTITFNCNFETGLATGLISEVQKDGGMRYEELNAPADSFLKALSIAIHVDGTPNWLNDYPEAESIMKPDGIRWIP